MDPIKCAFCQHGNPVNSRFCNACGAPLGAQRCAQCGAVSVTATTCQACGALRENSEPDDFFLPLPPDVPGGPRAVVQPTVAAEPLGHGAPQADELVTAAGPASAQATPRLLSAESAPEFHSTPSNSGAPADAPAAHTDSGALSPGATSSSRPRAFMSTIVVVALGTAVYFAYHYFQRFQPRDAIPHSTTTSEARDRHAPAAPTKPITAPATATPSAERDNPFRADGAPAAVPSRDRGTAAIAPSDRQVVGSCTEALAALGLCTQENTQGRKPR